jgi:hypothetical protein
MAHLPQFNVVKIKELIKLWRIHGALSIKSISNIDPTCTNPFNDLLL